MGRVVFIALFAACGAWITISAARTVISPRERWAAGQGRWMLFVSARRGEAPPGADEIRLWAAIWAAVEIAVIAVGVAIGLAG